MGNKSMLGKKRDVVQAAAQKRRIEMALSGIGGFCRGLDEIDVNKAASSMSQDERDGWARQARSCGRHLAQFARVLSREIQGAEATQD